MTRYSKAQQHRTSIARPRIVRGPAAEPARPKRDTRIGTTYGQQGHVTCGECGSTVTLKKAATGEFGREFGISKGELILSPHTPTGGRFSPIRGDVLCKGSRTLPS